MQYRTLGSTGLRVSVVGVGTWQFGGEWGKDFQQDEVTAMFDKAAELGINLIDTAECYGDHTSEAFIGQALTHHKREDWVLATKFGHKFHEPFKRDLVFDPEGVRVQLEDSLRALKTDYVDLYQFHSGSDELFDTDGLWEELGKLKDAGKVRHLGVSIGSNDNLYQTEEGAKRGSEAVQVVYNRLDRTPEKRVLPACQKLNLGVLVRLPLASGYLTGKYRPGDSFPANDVRAKWHKAEEREAKLSEAEIIAREEVPAGVPMAQWALGWCLKHEAVTCVIPGCKSVEQVISNAGGAEVSVA
jgi:aryl-alcohol dehydrogenase-like predicted oxidoreductase